MIDVFLSYRRSDTRADAGRVYDRLVAAFGDTRVFMDVDDIQPGENFVRVLEKTLDRCNVLLVLIGPRWLDDPDGPGLRRIDDAEDFVRMELERALERGIRIIPVLVGGAGMPAASELPDSIAMLAQQQAHVIQDGRFHPDVDRLVMSVERSGRAPFALMRAFRRHRALALLALIAGVALLGIAVLWPLKQQRALDASVTQHQRVAERFSQDGRYDSGIAELEKALALDPRRLETHRRMVELTGARLSHAAFASGRGAAHLGLSDDYRRQRLVSAEELDAALGRLYNLLALAPELEKDVDLLLAKSLMLKTSGARIDAAIETLERAHALAPRRGDVMAELGLLISVADGDARGLELLRDAVTLSPNSAAAHFYLGRGLFTVHRCTHGAVSFDGSACAEAIRVYHRASVLADGNDIWSRQIHNVSNREAIAIFRRVARGERDILDASLSMDFSERLSLLEYFLPRARGGGVSGWSDDRGYWLARLYEATGQPAQARKTIEQRMEELGRRPPLWLDLLERVSRSPT